MRVGKTIGTGWARGAAAAARSTSTAYHTALVSPAQLPRTVARDSQRGSTDERIGLHIHSVIKSSCLQRSATCHGQYIPHS